MKYKQLLKTLIDVLFFLHLTLLIVALLVLLFGVGSEFINVKDLDGTAWTWTAGIIALICAILFLRGLYYLRLIANQLLSQAYFSNSIIKNLQQSGNDFVLSGSLILLISFVLWIGNIFHGELNLRLDTEHLGALFLIIVGLFFSIQSKTLTLARAIKAENDLTV